MSQTVTLPDYWVLFTPEGKADESLHAVLGGRIRRATAEDAWKVFTPLKRDRDREQRQGWRVVGVDRADWLEYWEGRKTLPVEAVAS
jgi:hypothetical protein